MKKKTRYEGFQIYTKSLRFWDASSEKNCEGFQLYTRGAAPWNALAEKMSFPKGALDPI